MLRSGRCLYRLLPKTRGVSFVSRKKVPVTCLQTVRCMSGQGSSAGEQQDWSKAIVAGIVGVGLAGIIYYKKTSGGDKGSTSQTKEVVEKVSPPPPMVVGLPSKVPYLIIGAGTAGFAAYRSIRSMDPKAQVLLIGEEPYLPYMRPPLSKEMWYTDSRSLCQSLRFKQWNGKERSVFFEKEAYFCKPSELMEKETGGVSVVTGVKVVKLDVRDQKVYMNNGQELEYDKVLIATGGKPKNLPLVKEAGPEVARRCTLFRNVEDFRALDVVTQKNKSLAIIGGGFMGSELACALGKRGSETGMKVYQMFPEKGNMGQVLPEYLSKWSTEKVKKEGVEVIPESSLTGCRFDRSKNKIILTINGSKELLVDHIVVAVGLQPNVELSENAGLEVSQEHGGFLVNAELEARSNVWVAGDAACFYDIKLGRRRVEHHDHAVVSGRLAGENMTGASKPYWHQSMFWSDLGPEIGYEAIGIIDSSLPTVGVYAQADKMDTPKAVSEKTGEDLRSETPQDSVGSTEKPAGDGVTSTKDNYGKGVIFYMHDKKVVGLVLWNVFNKMGIARKVLREGKEFDDLTEVAKLFNLYGDPEKEPETETEESAQKQPM